MKAADKVKKARANLVMCHPFFGTLALRMKLKEDPGCGTAWTNGKVIAYDPAFIDKLTSSQVMGLIAHEVMHPGMLHHTRRGSREPRRWNAAADFAINPILTGSGFELPEEGCNDPKYAGMTAEAIYNQLPTDPGGPGGAGNDPGGNGEVRDGDGTTESQRAAEEADWKVAIAQAMHVAKQQGKVPAGLERLVDDLLEPVLPWRDILRRFLTERVPVDPTWSRPNRRLIHQGIYLPTAAEEPAGELVVIIDTSGSVGAEELRDFMSEVDGIKKDVRPTKLHVIYCDADVGHVDEFGPDDPLTVHACGGGGTEFKPAFDYIDEHGIPAKAVVYLTDGFSSFDFEPPAGYNVLWAINNDQVIPPWGEHLVFEPNG